MSLNSHVHVPRTSFAIACSVWKALLLREAVTRVSSSRTAWAWLLMEPVIHIAYIMFVYTVVHMRTVGGIETPIWAMTGQLTYLVYRRTSIQTEKAIGSNKAFYVYRQIKPVDCIFVRAVLELFLSILIASILFFAASMLGLDASPDDPLSLLGAFIGMWLAGLGFGLITSVVEELEPEINRVIGVIKTPLNLISGVIFPIAYLNPPYRDWLMLNPLAHGLEAARQSMATYYHPAPGVSLTYLYGFATVMIFIGLVLHRRFATKLAMK